MQDSHSECLNLLVQAISAWRDNSGFGRAQLVKQYFLSVEGESDFSNGQPFFYHGCGHMLEGSVHYQCT